MEVKVMLKFIADVLYIKEVICFEELDAIYDSVNADDLDNVFEKMMKGEFNVYRRGESYEKY